MTTRITGTGVLLRELTAAQVASLLDKKALKQGLAFDYPFESSRAAARGFQGRSTARESAEE